MDQLVTLAGLKTNQQLFTITLIQRLADHIKLLEIHFTPTNQLLLLRKSHSQNQKKSQFLTQRSAKLTPLSTINNENFQCLVINMVPQYEI
jgi:hypothetical protein